MITFESLLLAASIPISAGIITGFVELLKRVFPIIEARGWTLYLVFGSSLVLYVLVGIATGVSTLDAGLAVFLAWLGCATSSVGIHSTVTNVAGT